jgi:hypothetical protein
LLERCTSRQPTCKSGKSKPPLPILLAYARLAKGPMETLVDDDLDLP